MSNPFSRLVSRSRCTFALRFPWKTGALTTDYESSIRKIVEIAARALVFLGRNRQQCCSRRASIRMHRASLFERLARALPSLRIEEVDHPHPPSSLSVSSSSPPFLLLRHESLNERNLGTNSPLISKVIGEEGGSQLFTCTYFKIGTCSESRVATVYDNISSAVT